MTDETTTTEEVVEAPAPEQGQAETTTTEAEVTTTETQESTKTSSEQKANESSNDAEELSEWASKKGLSLNADNPNELKLAKMQREAEKKMHETTSEASQLKDAVTQAIPVGDGSDELETMRSQLQEVQVKQAISDFYAKNPEAKELDGEMGKLVQENPSLAQGGLEAVYAVAKVRQLQNGGEAEIKKAGGREALQKTALKQQAAAVAGNATKQTTSTGVTKEDVQAALQRGDREWIRKNMSAIDAL